MLKRQKVTNHDKNEKKGHQKISLKNENDTNGHKAMFWNWCDSLISTFQPLNCSKMTKNDFVSSRRKMTKKKKTQNVTNDC